MSSSLLAKFDLAGVLDVLLLYSLTSYHCVLSNHPDRKP